MEIVVMDCDKHSPRVNLGKFPLKGSLIHNGLPSITVVPHYTPQLLLLIYQLTGCKQPTFLKTVHVQSDLAD